MHVPRGGVGAAEPPCQWTIEEARDQSMYADDLNGGGNGGLVENIDSSRESGDSKESTERGDVRSAPAAGKRTLPMAIRQHTTHRLNAKRGGESKPPSPNSKVEEIRFVDRIYWWLGRCSEYYSDPGVSEPSQPYLHVIFYGHFKSIKL